MNFSDNWVQSVMVPYGYSLTLYEADGQSTAYKSEVQKGMGLNRQGMMQCVNLSDEMIKKTSSLMYIKDDAYDTPTNGVWKEVAAVSGGSTSYSITLSTTSTDSSTT